MYVYKKKKSSIDFAKENIGNKPLFKNAVKYYFKAMTLRVQLLQHFLKVYIPYWGKVEE